LPGGGIRVCNNRWWRRKAAPKQRALSAGMIADRLVFQRFKNGLICACFGGVIVLFDAAGGWWTRARGPKREGLRHDA
jgi:hypothetical protein